MPYTLSLPSYLKDRFIQISLGLSALTLFLSILLLLFKGNTLPHEVPFWYTLPTAHLLAPATNFRWLIAFAAGLWIFNSFLSFSLYRLYPAVSRVLSYASLLVLLLTAIAIIKTILIYLPVA